MLSSRCKKCKYFDYEEAKNVSFLGYDIEIVCCCHPENEEYKLLPTGEDIKCEYFEAKSSEIGIPGVKINIIVD